MFDKEQAIKELKQEIADMEASGFYSEKEIEGKKNLLKTFEMNLVGLHKSIPKWNKEDFLLPEYKKGGYFTSEDYYNKCDEFHKILEKNNIEYMNISREEYISLKKDFFKNTYNIIWLSEEEQFLPGTNIEVYPERLN